MVKATIKKYLVRLQTIYPSKKLKKRNKNEIKNEKYNNNKNRATVKYPPKTLNVDPCGIFVLHRRARGLLVEWKRCHDFAD